MSFQRYAIYVMPEPIDFAQRGAEWLGWDCSTGETVLQPNISNILDMTDRPRKYGFHGTVKAPFRLAEGMRQADLEHATAELCATLPAVSLNIELAQIGSFFAFKPVGETPLLQSLAAGTVRQLDRFRAPMTQDERARRNPEKLSDTLRAHLDEWGYPYVMDAFQFHITLTGPGQPPEVAGTLADHFAGTMPNPLKISSLSLIGERHDGRFVEIHRYALLPE